MTDFERVLAQAGNAPALRQLPEQYRPPIEVCEEDNCQFGTPKSRTMAMLGVIGSVGPDLYNLLLLLRIHEDNILADVLEDAIVNLNDAVQPALEARFAGEQ